MRRLTISLLRCLARLSGAGRAHNEANERAAEADILTARQAALRPSSFVLAVEKRKTRMHMYEAEQSTSARPCPAICQAYWPGQRTQTGLRTKDEGLWTTDYGLRGEGQTKLHELAKNERKNKVPLPRRWANNGGYTGATCRTFRIMCVQKMCWIFVSDRLAPVVCSSFGIWAILNSFET